MSGLVVLGAGLAQVVGVVTAWCVWDVATTDAYLLELEGWSKRRWLLLACVPLVGVACWIELARPTSEVGRVVPRQRRWLDPSR